MAVKVVAGIYESGEVTEVCDWRQKPVEGASEIASGDGLETSLRVVLDHHDDDHQNSKNDVLIAAHRGYFLSGSCRHDALNAFPHRDGLHHDDAWSWSQKNICRLHRFCAYGSRKTC